MSTASTPNASQGASALDASTATQLPTPLASPGFGPREAIDARRQAQFGDTADTPVDVNFNAIAGRSQFQTTDQAGKSFTSHSTRMEMLMERFVERKSLT